MSKFNTFFFILINAIIFSTSAIESISLNKSIEKDYPALQEIYKHLHSNPELSKHEVKTAQFMAKKLRALGYEVTEKFGGEGIVAVLKNGDGPTLMLRADMDGLPVLEETNLDYASKIITQNDDGRDVPVMHACGHDVHMTVLLGTAQQMVKLKDQWKGTLLLIGQPGEEISWGAKTMLKKGLFTKFPIPDFNLAMHVAADLPAGKIGYVEGYSMANVDSVDIIVKGKGGHGAYPHKTKDPIVIAAAIIMQLQTIVSRELSPLDSAVVTIGSIHGGTKHNIISNQVKLQLTVRSYADETRSYLLNRIKEISEGVAHTAGMPDDLLPKVEVKAEHTPSVYNEPKYTKSITTNLKRTLGNENVVEVSPVMAGEDFGRYGRTKEKIPSTLLWLGAVDPNVYQRAKKEKQSLPSLHSAKFAPLPELTISTGVKGMTESALMLLKK
ncbi:MAG: M20 metallopeptidase family protein [Kangiellaceae bacterium]